MALMVLTAEYISINSNDLKAYCDKAELTVNVAEEDVTTFNSAGWKEVTGGLKSGQLAIEFIDDYAASALDSILWPLFIAGVPVPFEVRPTQSAAGTSNPKWTGNVLLSSHTAGGQVGNVAKKSLTFTTSGAVTRATA